MLEAELEFKAATGLKSDLWFGVGPEPAPAATASRARVALSNLAALEAWLDFDRIRTACADELEGPLVDACIRGQGGAGTWPLARTSWSMTA